MNFPYFIGSRHARLGLASLLFVNFPALHALEDSDRLSAVNATITNNQACISLSRFYWEIGDKVGGLGHVWSGTGGALGIAPSASQQIAIYSAGKWIWGAYAYERLGSVLDAANRQFLTMTAGYLTQPGANQCTIYTTVESCRDSMPDQDSAEVGRFNYGSGHFQNQAVESFKVTPTPDGLGPMNKSQLAAEIRRVVGTDIALSYNAPQLAGGAKSSATDYAKFLRKILNGQLRIGSALGSDAVCTLDDDAVACDAGYSPANDAGAGLQEAWHYSIGHWVEDAPGIGDSAYSSPGAAGFYPWIDSSQTYYGILARNVVGTASAGNSVKCGRKIRAAWLSGNPQLE